MWKFKNKLLQDISDFEPNTYGFIYQTLHVPTNKRYIGKKVLFFNRNKKLGKKELLILKEERKSKGIRGKTPTKKLITLESDWREYYGSHEFILKKLKENKQNEFKREILCLAHNKKHLTYLETKYLFDYNVLESEEYLNTNILGKFFKKDFVVT